MMIIISIPAVVMMVVTVSSLLVLYKGFCVSQTSVR